MPCSGCRSNFLIFLIVSSLEHTNGAYRTSPLVILGSVFGMSLRLEGGVETWVDG